MSSHPTPRTLLWTDDSTHFAEVLEAYRQTVLTVDHWHAAYGESTVAESVASEFSQTLAHLVVDLGTAPFISAVRAQFSEAGEQAIAVRKRTLSCVEAEGAELDRLRAGLRTVATLLTDIQADQEQFEEGIGTVQEARQKLDRLCKTYQAYIHSHPRQRYS